jgi:acetate CoA/acetoacetate CoA-transferase alpha subunit
VLTASGIGTGVEEGRQEVTVAGKDYLAETAMRADFALATVLVAQG